MDTLNSNSQGPIVGLVVVIIALAFAGFAFFNRFALMPEEEVVVGPVATTSPDTFATTSASVEGEFSE